MATGATRARWLGRLPGVRGVTHWARNAWIALIVIGASLAAGLQFAHPNRRVLQVMAAGAIIASALRMSSFSSLLILVVAFPFRAVTSYGTTTTAFTLLVFILWVARLALGSERPAGRSSIDIPVAALVCAYLLSFSQVEVGEWVVAGVESFIVTLTSIFFGYLVIHLVQTEKHLRRIVGAIVLLTVLLQLISIFELAFPSRQLIPGWITLGSFRYQEAARLGLEIKNFRVGSVFADFELFSEFCAMMMILLWFILMRSRGPWARVAASVLLMLNTFALLATVTRGAIISLALAAGYLMWRVRRRVRFHTLVLSSLLVLLCGGTVLEVVAHHTRSGNILERLGKTHFEGLAPDDRAAGWENTWDRIAKQPILGYGPYFGKVKEATGVVEVGWPHNVYLFYLHTVGLVGLSAYLWILYCLWRATRRSGSYLSAPSYASSLLLALEAMFLLFVVDQIKIEYLRNDAYQYWVWLFFGLIVATSRIVRDQQAAEAAVALPATPAGPAGPANGRARRLPAVSPLVH